MAVNLGIGQRNMKSGIQGNRKPAQIPTGPSRTVGVANDPGVAGGPSSIPAGAFGPDGNVEAGRQIQAGANTIIADEVRAQRALQADILRKRLRMEEVEISTTVEEYKTELTDLSSKVDTRLHSGPGQSPLEKYKLESEKRRDDILAKQQTMSPGSMQKLKLLLDSKLKLSNASVDKSLDDLKEAEYIDLSTKKYREGHAFHRDDLNEGLLTNTEIYEDTRLGLGEEKARELYNQANEDTVLTRYNSLLDAGEYRDAEAALDDPRLAKYISSTTRRAKFKEVREARMNREVARQVKQKSKAGAQTDQEKRDDTIKFLKDNDVKVTEELILKVANLSPENVSIFTEKLNTIDGLNLNPDQKEFLKERLVAGAPTKIEEQLSVIQNMVEDETISEEEGEEMKKSIASGGADTRTPEKIGQDKSEETVAEAKANLAAGLPTTLGTIAGKQEAAKTVAEARALKEANYFEPVAVGSKETNSIRTLSERYVEYVRKNGNVQLIEGGAQMLGKLVSNAETLLKTGKADSIGQAVFLAYNDIPENERPVRITGLSQVEDMIKDSNASATNTTEEALSKDVGMLDGTKAQAVAEVDALDLSDERYKGLSIKNATGIPSGLRSFVGSTIAQFPGLGGFESKDVTQARLMFSLVARDVVRMISLSPRFAVKEQELIQSMFAGPEIFNSPRQALNKIRTMQSVIDTKIKGIVRDLKRNPGFDKESELVGDASQLLEIKSRMNMFTFDLIPIEKVQTAAAVRKLSPAKRSKFYSSLSARERQELPLPVLRALTKKKKQ